MRRLAFTPEAARSLLPSAVRTMTTGGFIPGAMQRGELLVSNIIRFAAEAHGDCEVVSRSVEGPIHRYHTAWAHWGVARAPSDSAGPRAAHWHRPVCR